MRIASLTANAPRSEIGYLLHSNIWVEPFEKQYGAMLSLRKL